MLVNLSNHPSEKWGAKQLETAKKEYGCVRDLPFPEIDPYSTSGDIDCKVEEYYQRIAEIDPAAVMLQGEYIFTYRLICRLKEAGIRVIASCSERRTIEYINDDGMTARKSEFEFVGFKEY